MPKESRPGSKASPRRSPPEGSALPAYFETEGKENAEAENCDRSVLEKRFWSSFARGTAASAVPQNEYCARDLRLLLPAGSLPPDFGILGTIEHVRQFLFDLAQTGGA
jgi:hypothetical protein